MKSVIKLLALLCFPLVSSPIFSLDGDTEGLFAASAFGLGHKKWQLKPTVVLRIYKLNY